ncbi:hypothetical protein P3X46_034141 [Hevea brasiliensis]|uniref:Uncharacterized protein n=1 Tax=Hevea brasiliensis TaxID=3981 RepID=A0ABQ9K937_HEVBR|nr:hypothetical protein P3X46_034141 [Hevea brasiliensis]
MRGVKLFIILASSYFSAGPPLQNKVQVYRSVRMPQLHTSLHFHLTPIVMINGSSRRDLLLNSQNFCHSIPAEQRTRRSIILGWAYYLYAFSSYPLLTWLPSVYRGHDFWYTIGGSFPVLSSRTALMGEQPNPWNILQPQVAKSRHRGAKPSRRCEYPFVEGPSSFSWEYGMGYFSAVAPAYNFHRTVLSKEQLFSKSQKVLSWNPILTKDSCGSGGSSYRKTRNGELPPPFRPLFGLKNAGFKNE